MPQLNGADLRPREQPEVVAHWVSVLRLVSAFQLFPVMEAQLVHDRQHWVC
jgi:hypothetical protein